ncbi:MAG: universal stress protein [Thermodesulfobacteriota bacterium]
MKLKKILWAFDGSDESKNALKYAVNLARMYNSAIKGLYVNLIEYPFIFYYPYYEEFVMEKAGSKEKEFRKKFKSITEDLTKKKIEFNSRIVSGYPEDKILSISSKENSDLIVMGVTGRNFIDRMVIGSTTLRVLRKSKIPVLAVKSKRKDKDIKFNKLLIPIDLSDKLDLNLMYSLEIADRNSCQITVLYIVSGIDHSDVLAPSLINELMSGAEKELKKAVNNTLKKTDKSEETAGNIKIKTKVLFSYNVPLEIADYARKNKFDLISINSHKKNMLKRLFLGSVAEQVIRYSNCNVLIIKP